MICVLICGFLLGSHFHTFASASEKIISEQQPEGRFGQIWNLRFFFVVVFSTSQFGGST